MPDILTRERLQHFREAGYVRLSRFLSADDVAALTALFREHEPMAKAEYGKGLVVLEHAFRLSATARRSCHERALATLGRRLLSAAIRLHGSQFVCKTAHSSHEWHWHQDVAYHAEVLGKAPAGGLTAWMPMTDVTLESGCLHVVPGSHVQGVLAHRDRANQWVKKEDRAGTALPVKSGGLILFHSRLLHRSGGNRNGSARLALLVECVTRS